eukprot:12203446-Karenia_brevis.AAC.1
MGNTAVQQSYDHLSQIRQLDSVKAQSILEQWRKSCMEGLRVLRYRSDVNATFPLGENGKLSMMAHDDVASGGVIGVSCVHWQSVKSFLGRPVYLDDQYGVKALMCTGNRREPTSYEHGEVVLTTLGIRMIKPRGAKFERPKLTVDQIRLLNMWNAAQASQDLESRDALPEQPCAVCDSLMLPGTTQPAA